ncbi:MAG: deoxyhypusine synthase family protein, partial [Methanobacteriales archaeon]|nr:deoxyhypusine synthase family protein [Methanobacteriales archaeon]
MTMRVQHMTIKGEMKVKELIDEMGRAGVLGAGRVYKATRLLSEMFQDNKMNIFLSMAGPLVAGGMRRIISDLLREGRIQALITSGANLTHDLL